MKSNNNKKLSFAKGGEVKKIKDILLDAGFEQDSWWKLSKDAYGTPQPDQYGFWDEQLTKRYGEDIDTGKKLDEELDKLGIESVNIWVGSAVHGWTHRKLFLKSAGKRYANGGENKMENGGVTKEYYATRNGKHLYKNRDAIWYLSYGTYKLGEDGKEYSSLDKEVRVYRKNSGLSEIKHYRKDKNYRVIDERSSNGELYYIAFLDLSDNVSTIVFSIGDLYANGGSLNKIYRFDEFGDRSFKNLIDEGVFVSKFKAKQNAMEFNRIKFNRMDNAQQIAYEKKLNKEKITYNLKLGQGGHHGVSKEVYDYAQLPETEEKNYYIKYEDGGGIGNYSDAEKWWGNDLSLNEQKEYAKKHLESFEYNELLGTTAQYSKRERRQKFINKIWEKQGSPKSVLKGLYSDGGGVGYYDLKETKDKNYFKADGVFNEKPEIKLSFEEENVFSEKSKYAYSPIYVNGVEWFGAKVEYGIKDKSYYVTLYDYSTELMDKIKRLYTKKDDLINDISENLKGQSYVVFGTKNRLQVSVPANKMKDGGWIGSMRGIATDYKSAIADLIEYYRSKSEFKLLKYAILTQEQGEYLYNAFKDYESLKNEDGEYVAEVKFAYDGKNFEETKEQDEALTKFLEELEETDFIYFDEFDSVIEAYPIAIEFIDAVRARILTRENVSKGADLFPDTSMIKVEEKSVEKTAGDVASEIQEAISYLQGEADSGDEEAKEALEYLRGELGINKPQAEIGEYYDLRLPFGSNVSMDESISRAIRDLFIRKEGKIDKEIMDRTISALGEKTPEYIKGWNGFKSTFSIEEANGNYVNPFYADGGDVKEALTGGKADGMTLDDIAKMHGVLFDHIMRQAKIGMTVEREHTSDENKIIEIVKDHLYESPDYYTKLQKIESSFENGGGVDGYYLDVPSEYKNMFTMKSLMEIRGMQIDSGVQQDNGAFRFTFQNEMDLDRAIAILNQIQRPNFGLDMPQNLSQLKNYIQVGKLLRVSYNKNRPDFVGKMKVIVQVQTNGFYMMDGVEVPTDLSKKSWIEYPKTNMMAFSPFWFTIYANDKTGNKVKLLQYEYVTGQQEVIVKSVEKDETFLFNEAIRMNEFVDSVYGLSDSVEFCNGGTLTPDMFNNALEYNLDKESVSCFINAKSTGRTLMLRRAGSDYNGTWSLISGGVETGESSDETIKREIQEELGVNLNCNDLILSNATKHPDRTHYYYEMTVNEEFEPTLNPENDAFMWINMGELPSNTHPLLKKYIKSEVFA